MVAKTKSDRASQADVLRRWSDAWAPVPDVDRATWCAEHLRLPAESIAAPGPYNLDDYPYCRGVLEAGNDPEVEMIVLKWATQLGKTTLLQAMLAVVAALAPLPALFVTPDRDATIELRDKFYALCEASPVLANRVPPARLRNDRWIDVGRMRCHLAWSYSTQRLSGKSCGLVLCTEVDRYRKRPEQGDPLKLAQERVKAFHRYKILVESTPTDDDSRIEATFAKSDRRQFYVPCPHCNHWQPLRFFPHRDGPYAGNGGVAGLKDKEGNWASPDTARQEAHYRCEHGCRIDDEQKNPMVREGRWVAAGQHIDKAGRLRGAPEQSPRIWGAELNSLYSPAVSCGRMAAEYLDARENRGELQSFYQNWLARKWSKKPEAPKWKTLGRRLRAPHQRGAVPAAACFLTAGVDVGEAYAKWVIRAWGEGATSWLIDWGTTHRRATADGMLSRTSHLDALLDQVVDRQFALPVDSVTGRTALGVRLTAIDSGFEPGKVHALARLRRERIYTVAGSTKLAGQFYKQSIVERNARTGQVYPGGLVRWEVNRLIYNVDVQDRWRAPLDEPGAWLLYDVTPEQLEPYLIELVNEVPVQRRNKLGRMVTEWTMVDTNIGNHFWDAEVYARAAADMVVGGDFARLAEKVRRAFQAPPPSDGRNAAEVTARAAMTNQDFSAR